MELVVGRNLAPFANGPHAGCKRSSELPRNLNADSQCG
jgi:hypothetical protein